MMRRLVFAVMLLVGMAGQSLAEARIALVVGNGAYSSVTPLDNPVQDATLIAETLSGLGFTVTLVTDADQAGLHAAIGAFGKALRAAGTNSTGLFYYAGHGVQSFGTNYILPVDAALTDAADLGLVGIEAQSILRQMSSAKNRTNIMILDACRNNPFENLPDLDDNGLAEMKAPTGTYLAYATAPGSVALDGLGGNSPFTQALAELMLTPGLPLEQMFKQVRVRVIEATSGKQTPWDASSVTAEFAFAPADPGAAAAGETGMWEQVKAKRDSMQIRLFLRAFPGSQFEPDARALLDQVMTEELASNAAKAGAEPVPDSGIDAAAVAAVGEVSFSSPLNTLDDPVAGKSIGE